MNCEYLGSKLDQLTLGISSLTESLVGKRMGQDIEYDEESVDNAPAVDQSTFMSVDLKVRDNMMCIVMALFIAPQPAAPPIQ